MKTVLRTLLLLPMLSSLCAAKPAQHSVASLPANVEVIRIPTSSPENLEVPFYVRPPLGYDPTNPATRGKVYRILFICPILNGDGINVITKHSQIGRAHV